MSERITLQLNEATTEQLQKALSDAETGARKCREQRTFPEAWESRASAIRRVLAARRDRETGRA